MVSKVKGIFIHNIQNIWFGFCAENIVKIVKNIQYFRHIQEVFNVCCGIRDLSIFFPLQDFLIFIIYDH